VFGLPAQLRDGFRFIYQPASSVCAALARRRRSERLQQSRAATGRRALRLRGRLIAAELLAALQSARR